MITYPVDVQNSRFTFISGGVPVRGKIWPAADGMQIPDLDPSVSVLEEFRTPDPAFDPATQKLDDGAWVDDIPNQTATFSRSVVSLSQAELDAVAAAADRDSKKQTLAGVISTYELWESQLQGYTVTTGNSLATLQNLIDHQRQMYRDFAYLLEWLRINL